MIQILFIPLFILGLYAVTREGKFLGFLNAKEGFRKQANELDVVVREMRLDGMKIEKEVDDQLEMLNELGEESWLSQKAKLPLFNCVVCMSSVWGLVWTFLHSSGISYSYLCILDIKVYFILIPYWIFCIAGVGHIVDKWMV